MQALAVCLHDPRHHTKLMGDAQRIAVVDLLGEGVLHRIDQQHARLDVGATLGPPVATAPGIMMPGMADLMREHAPALHVGQS